MAPSFALTDPYAERSIGVEASARTLQCSLVLVALRLKTSEVSLAQLLRELYTLLTGNNLTVIGLRAQAPLLEAAESQAQFHRWWPPAAPSRTEQFAQWSSGR